MSRLLQLRTTGPEQTQAVAARIAAVAVAGDVVALTGELGAGKTCFVQGAAAALGVTDRVTSPSFILRKEYQGRLPILHLDVYRLESMQEAMEIGFAEALDSRRVTFVEWGDAMAPLLPPDHLEVELRLPPLDAHSEVAEAADWAPEPRLIVLRPHGPTWRRRVAELGPSLQEWATEEEQD